ncbi:zn-dependent protease : Matrixin OS=Singulisphaera acidiphila (strain ATCC BAA-1392 / DSM 18658 / VKM B-2454 / MOB10) GN=Sinac_4791 PE=4 SV=1: Peptidase_M10: PPC [Gemmata massiliana]|uniref:Peptidase M10 metallopeptidase domain-containing protein n=1 Tax=Gemmata massiliana TaxID=1210884 RepID=A0A6P2D213_9BACT|nr:matrixin family metalloprotease [Gemmata massiliana]VTR94616.1 zn-dependent protease : Matrixin OS=Singulisphaera acidiphila (strain ATCC BAA-1392 / DSM 18658 / VKM B-2454 / MOB10) GN=Sinac_4791 PE=4 SV=1: Peptidase_M10: PPC [Gemmata massiliana]
MSQSLSPKRLSVEHLEDRLTPTFGTPWFDGSSLTLSFVPDGTDVSGQQSNLFALMNATASQPQWQREILRAYQTWAVEANLNIGLVADGGQAMGTAGAPQEDIRFGDIRIGARALSAPGSANSTMANAVGFDYDSRTWAGDFIFNSLYQFGIGSSYQGDLFSVALHEAAHSFGLADQNTDATSVLFNSYQGLWSGLSLNDVASIRGLYGARQNDQFEGLLGNDTLATAYNLGNTTAVSADVTRLGDADVYKFTTPASGATGLTINLQAAGISLLTGKVTVYDAQGNVVASASTSDVLNNNLSITLANYRAGTTYYVKVQGSGSDVFSIGSYVLRLNYSGGSTTTGTSVTNSYYTNFEFPFSNNDTLATANTLSAVRSTKSNTFALQGFITSATDVDWYKITPTLATGFTGTLFIGTMTATNGLLPSVTVYNASGQLLPTVVTMNEGGSYAIQLANATTGTTYYIRVGASTAAGSSSFGMYTLGATLAPVAPTTYTQVTSDTLTQPEAVQYTTIDVAGDRLTQFALTATGGSSTSATAVRMTIFDATGHAVFTTVARAGLPLTTGAVWLVSGSYTVVFNAATLDGSSIQSLGLVLSARTLSDPLDPIVENPTVPPPPPLSPITAPTPAPTPPPTVPVIGPVTNPFTPTPTYPTSG